MIRRLFVAIAALAVTSTVAAGCSTFTKNTEAAKVGNTTLSVKDFEAIGSGLATAGSIDPPLNGEFSSTSAHSVLTRWIVNTMLHQKLAAEGIAVPSTTVDAAKAALSASTTYTWSAINPTAQSFMIDELAAQQTLVTSSLLDDAAVEAAYNRGIGSSNTLCLRVIVFTDSTKAANVYTQLQGGADFATTADANNSDPTAGKGGVYTDSRTNSECVSGQALNPQVGQALAQVPIGSPTQPITFTASDGSSQYVIFMQRPWSEVAKAAAPVVRQALGPAAERNLITGTPAFVDSRYGMWDPTALTVSATR